MQNRENKKRKGISLSVTPHKQNHAVNERPASTPKNSTIELQQSFVNVE